MNNLGPSFTQYLASLTEWLDPYLIDVHVAAIREDYMEGLEPVHCADRVADMIVKAYEKDKGSKMYEAARMRDLCDLPPLEA